MSSGIPGKKGISRCEFLGLCNIWDSYPGINKHACRVPEINKTLCSLGEIKKIYLKKNLTAKLFISVWNIA